MPTEPVAAYIGLGANLDTSSPDTGLRTTAADTLVLAIGRLNGLPHSRLLAWSSLYRSAPIEATGPDFHNAVACVTTGLDAGDLLAGMQRIEDEFGRQRPYRNAPRTLDLDLLLYGDHRLDAPSLVVPHPRLASRAFVLRPLAELAPALVIPGLGPLSRLLPAVADQQISRIGPIDVILR